MGGRVYHGWECRPDLVQVDNKRNPKEYLGKFWTDCLVEDRDVLMYNVRLLGEDRVLLGTDYPFPLGEWEPGALVESTPFTDTVKNKILWKNGLEFVNRPESDFVDTPRPKP